MGFDLIEEEQWSRLKRVLNFIQKKSNTRWSALNYMKHVRANLFFHCSSLEQDAHQKYWIVVRVEGKKYSIDEALNVFPTLPVNPVEVEYSQYSFLVSCKRDKFIEVPHLGKGLLVKKKDEVEYTESRRKEVEQFLQDFSCPSEIFDAFHCQIEKQGYFYTTVQNCVWTELLRQDDKDGSLELERCPACIDVQFCAPFPGKGVNPEIKREFMQQDPGYKESWSEEEEE